MIAISIKTQASAHATAKIKGTFSGFSAVEILAAKNQPVADHTVSQKPKNHYHRECIAAPSGVQHFFSLASAETLLASKGGNPARLRKKH